jgi:signal transduction histidine kinase
MAVAFDGLGYRLVTVHSGRDALRRLLLQDFALILLDVQMPTMSGFETAQLIRARGRSRHVPIIFMTADSRDGNEVRKAYRLGAVDFLLKPLQPEILRAKAAVFVALQRRRLEAERQREQIRAHAFKERENWGAKQRARFEAEELKRRLEEQALHAGELRSLNQRLEAIDGRKNEFIAVLGHELRNPLASLVSGLEMLKASSNQAVAQVGEVMRRQVQQLIRQVDDLLDVSRISGGSVELRRSRVRAAEVIDQAVSLATPLLTKRRHRLTTERAGEDTAIFGDEVRLTQVLANLLNNAARYTDPGGQITLSCVADVDGVTFSVKDNGRGISPELLPRVFDLFVQEREGGGGLGIGLTLVKQLVQMHQGRVQALSQGPGRGSEFLVWLPACSESVVSAPHSAPLVPDPETRRALHVVLVDDNDDARLLLGEVLLSWGHAVSHAATAAAGADLILACRPDIAFIDIGLPDADGYELARRVRGGLTTQRPILVALTGFGQLKDRELASSAGFDHHLAKPASSAAIQSLLGEAHTRCETALEPEAIGAPREPSRRARLDVVVGLRG